MALVSVSSRCFDAVNAALEAVRRGDAQTTANILRSIRLDSLLLKREALSLRDRLKLAECRHQRKTEDLTRQMNDLHAEEMKMEDKKRELANQKSLLSAARDQHHERWRQAKRRCSEAIARQQEAEMRPNKYEPLVVVELIGNSSISAGLAGFEADRNLDDMRRAENAISDTDLVIRQVTSEATEISRKVRDLKRQQDICHKELGDVKSMTSFIMQGVAFWEEVIQLTKTATVSTEHLQRIVGLASKRNTVRIMRSRGTQTMVRSFKDCWMEVADTLTSADNGLWVLI